MTTWAQWRKAAETPFKEGEQITTEDGQSRVATYKTPRTVKVAKVRIPSPTSPARPRRQQPLR